MLYWLAKIFSYLLNTMPQKSVLFFGDLIGWLWFYVLPIRRKVVLENLSLAFKDQYSNSQIQRIALENYKHYGKVLLELTQSLTWTTQEFRDRFEVTGIHHLEGHIAQGQGIFTLCLHMGNWELLIGSGAAIGIRADVVVKTQVVKSVQGFLEKFRKNMNVGVLPEEGSAKDMLRALSRGRAVAFVNDQFMGPPIGLPVEFFGEKAGTAVAVALMTDKRDVPIIPIYSYRSSDGKLHTVIEPPLEFPNMPEQKNQRLYYKTQVLNDCLEKIVRRHPEQWLWIHRRWKPFVGEPRWKLQASHVVLAAAALLFTSCASKNGQPSSGNLINLPPETKISVPEFESKEVAETKTNVIELPENRHTATKKLKRKKPVAKVPSAKQGAKKAQPKKYVFNSYPEDLLPFEIGEKLKIDLSWLAVPAGSATLEVKPGVPVNGRPTFKLWGVVASNSVVDLVYRVENIISSTIDKEGLIPYRFSLLMDEKLQYKKTRVSFDHNRSVAHYVAERKSKRWGDMKANRGDNFTPGAQDMFSALYFVRTLEFNLGEEQKFWAFENGKNYEIKLQPMKKEVVSTKAGVFQCWKVKVNVALNNALRPMGDVFIWLSDDSKKYLVKFEAKIKIGALIGTLTEVTDAS